MNYIDLPKEACFTPIYSPRTALSKTNAEIQKLTTNLAINIDKYILGFFKDTFERNDNQVSQNEFISQGLKHMKSWQRQLKYRNQKIHLCLHRLFQEADSNSTGYINWSQFNSMLIEKGLNLKSLRNQEAGNSALMKPVSLHGHMNRHGSVVQKMINLGNKIAILTEQSKEITFHNFDGTPANLKPLVLSQQSLTVQTSMAKRNKSGRKEVVKKDLVVAEYKNIILDMIYINDSKYNMLITSSTDFMIRGWDINSNIPQLAKQPQNEDEKMQHQFSTEIHTMAWDSVNEILYCCGKSPIIYEWMVKTDSERELTDLDGHTEMISAMIMMPKLQFLATGGYDGKLILWDTISQTKKFKYKEHTRSISSMTFHQGLILLFTSAYDHSICVWNPYIQSLIHKIISNTNFIQLDIIPQSNLLTALDTESNVKIRQINKFSLVSSFSIDKIDNKIEPTCMISTEHPLRYYFGGSSVVSYEYVHIDANVIRDSTVLCLKYDPNNFTLYSPVKNHVVAWDLLTGTISNTLRDQSPGEITAFGVFINTKLSVIGDSEGNLLLRKLQNGVLVKKLFKHKFNITYILVEQLKYQKIIFSVSYDGQIAVFNRDSHGDFNHYRNVSVKKISSSSNVTSLCYQQKRSILIIGTNLGEILLVDIDKNKMISRCETKTGDIERFVYLEADHMLLSFNKKSQIFGLYLPPHIKKFKPSCHFVSQQTHTKILSVAMSLKTKRTYIGFENGQLMCFCLNQDLLSNSSFDGEEKSQLIRPVWKSNLGEAIKSLILIESEDILVAIVGANKILLLGCDYGDQIAELSQKHKDIQPPPVLYLDEEKDSIYIKQLDKFIPIKPGDSNQQIRRLFDPTFYLEVVKHDKDMIDLESNKDWNFYPNINDQTKKTIDKTLKLLSNIKQYEQQPKKLHLVKAESQHTFDMSRVYQIKEKWDRQKEEDQFGRTNKQHSMHAQSGNIKASKHSLSKSIFRQSSYKSKSSFKESSFKLTKKQTISITSPLYRLGVALKSLNQRDKKAQQLVDLAELQYMKSKSNLKLPKITSSRFQ